MSERAEVTSIQAIDAFRARLVLFMSKARTGLEEASDEVQRTQNWLDNDRRSYWERELRRRQRQLDEAKQELLNAKLSRIRVQTAAQVLLVERAKRAVSEAEEKRDSVKKWSREFTQRAEPLAKQVEQLLTFVGTDLSKAAVYLESVVRLLEGYALTAAASSGPVGAAPPAEGVSSEDDSTRSAQEERL